MSFDNSKYDVELNGVPHRIRGYVKNEAPAFVPRIAAGGQSETEFNSLLSKTLKSFAGGILQRKWENDETLFATEGLYPIYEDGVVYPVNAPTTRTDLGSGRPIILAWCKTKDYVYIAWQGTTGGPSQGIKRIDTSGTVVSLTVPANISSITNVITTMVIWRNQLWVSATKTDLTTGSLYYMDISSTTLNDITSGTTFYAHRLLVFKDRLYATNSGATPGYALLRYTGSTSSKSYEDIASTPGQFADFGAELFTFNNRIYLARIDGLFAYDGTQFITVVDCSDAVDAKNFRFPKVLKGYLYYFMPDGFYRYNGSLVEKLYDISEIGFPKDVCVGNNRLWISYTNSAYSGSSRYDKSMGYNYSVGLSGDGRVAVFNGKGMYTYVRTSTFTKAGSPLLAQEGEVHRVIWFNNKLIITTYAEPSSTHYTVDTDEQAASGTKTWRMVTSIFDGDFAMVDKNLESVELVTDGNVASDESITVEYRTGGFDGSTGWTTLGTIKSQTELKRYVWKSIPAGLTFRRIQFRLTGTTTAGYGFAKLVLRYTLSPDFKWQWQFDVLGYGDDPTSPLMLADGTASTQAVRTLRGNIYAARSSDVPVKYLDIDKLTLNGAHNSAVTTITVNSTALLKGDEGFIQIDDEVMYWYAKTATTLTVVRAQLSTAAASHTDNTDVFIAYRVLVKQIPRETVTMTDNGRQDLEDKDYQSVISVVLNEV